MADESTGQEQVYKKWNMGNIPPEGHDDVGKFSNGLWEEAKHDKIDRLGMHTRWIDLHTQWRGKKRRRTYPKVGANYLFKTVNSFCAILTEKTPKSEVQTNDDINQDLVRAFDEEQSEWWSEQEMQNMLYSSVQNMNVYGSTIEKGVYDIASDSAKILLRDPFNFFPAPGYKLCTMDLPYCCDAEFMDTWKVRQMFEVPDHINIPADAEEVLLGTQRETTRGGRTRRSSAQTRNLPSNYSVVPGFKHGQAMKNKTLVVEIWIKDHSMQEVPIMGSVPVGDEFGNYIGDEEQVVDVRLEPVYPDGIRKVTIAPGMATAQNKGVLDDGRNPNINWNLVEQRFEQAMTEGVPSAVPVLADGKPVIDPETQEPAIEVRLVPVDEDGAKAYSLAVVSKTYLFGRFPYSAVPSQSDTTQWFGFSVLEQLEELQGRVEGLLTKYITYYEKAMFPILVLPEGCGVENSEISNKPSLIIRPTIQTAALVEYVSVPQLPQGFLDLVQFLLFQMDVISGSPEVTEGRRPKGVSAASAIIALQDKAATLMQPMIRNIDELIRNRGRMFISFVQNFGTKEKPVKVDDEFIKFIGTNLQATFKFMVESGSSAPITKAGRRQQYIELFKIEAMDLESLLEMLEIPKYRQVVERVTEQNSLGGAMDILIQAGLPEEEAIQLYKFLLEDQGGTGRKEKKGNPNPTKYTGDGRKTDRTGRAESTEALRSQLQPKGE